jgi:hypothetical protein
MKYDARTLAKETPQCRILHSSDADTRENTANTRRTAETNSKLAITVDAAHAEFDSS